MSHPSALPSSGCNNRHMCQPWNAKIDRYEHMFNSKSVGNNICDVKWNGICNMAAISAIAFVMAAMVAVYL